MSALCCGFARAFSFGAPHRRANCEPRSPEEQLAAAFSALDRATPPCGAACPGDCGWNPDDPGDPCAPAPEAGE